MTLKSTIRLASIPPEVILEIASHLSPRDLAQCVLVNQSWFGIFTPVLWQNIGAYRPRELQRFNCQESLLALIRNSGHIRHFGTCFMNLAATLASWSTDCTRLHTLTLISTLLPSEFPLVSLSAPTTETSKHNGNNSMHSTAEVAMELLRRNRCIRQLRLEGDLFWDSAKKSVLTRVLDNCPATVERLKLDFKIGAAGQDPIDGKGEALFYPRTTLPPPRLDALRELVLNGSISDHPAMLSFLERCPSLEQLGLNYVEGSFFTASSPVLHEHCPRLDMLVCQSDGGEHDHQLASLLRSSRTGWRSVSLPFMENFGERTWEALMDNAKTLEQLEAIGWGKFLTMDAQAFLCSAKRLRKLAGGGDSLYYMFTLDIVLRATDMIESGSWVCSKTLEYLDLRIEGIPRADAVCRHDGTPFLAPLLDLDEMVTNREAHRCVYAQLGALTQLRELRLGEMDESQGFKIIDLDLVTLLPHLHDETRGQHVRAFQYQCLEFSLENGLDMLRDMKKMEVLDVRRMAHRIGVEELEWMHMHWPKLRKIEGLLSDRLWEGKGVWTGRQDVEKWVAAHPLGIGSFYYAEDNGH